MPGTLKLIPRYYKRGQKQYCFQYANSKGWKAQIDIWREMLRDEIDGYFLQFRPETRKGLIKNGIQ